MKKILLPEKSDSLHYYRANLHCHSTISDGRLTVEEIKKLYTERGYSVVAFTDHDAFLQHNDLTDENFLALNGYEVEISEETDCPFYKKKTCHLCFVALDPDTKTQVCYHRTRYLGKNAALYRDRLIFDESLPDYDRHYTPECVNDMIRRAKEGGFFVTYNHPTWSLEEYPNYMAYEGMDAMEIENSSSNSIGYDEHNGHCYNDMIRGGKRLYCVATDDNHNKSPYGDPKCDSFGGYIMIAADKLEYRTITAAMKAGSFYASSGTGVHDGPEILSLVWEDGTVTIRTSPARTIMLTAGQRKSSRAVANYGETITETAFSIAEDEKWFRLTVTDEKGYNAYTNAYFPEDLN